MKRRMLLQTNHLPVFADNYVEGGTPNTNYSNSIGLIVKTQGTSVTRRTFIQFKANNFAKFTKLRLYQYAQSGSSGGVLFISITIDLMPNVDLTTLTWNNQPSPITSSIATFNSVNNGEFIFIDLPLLSSFSDDTLTIRLRGVNSNEKAVFFASNEHPSQLRPILL